MCGNFWVTQYIKLIIKIIEKLYIDELFSVPRHNRLPLLHPDFIPDQYDTCQFLRELPNKFLQGYISCILIIPSPLRPSNTDAHWVEFRVFNSFEFLSMDIISIGPFNPFPFVRHQVSIVSILTSLPAGKLI